MKSKQPRKNLGLLVWLGCWLASLSGLAGAPGLGQWKWCDPSPQGNGLNAITYANGLFVGVGNGGTIVTSVDARAWTVRESGKVGSLRAVTFGGGRFVAVSLEGALLSSTDGTSWSVDRAGSLGGLVWTGVAYGNGRFLAVGCDGKTALSTNGTDWVDQSPPPYWSDFIACASGGGVVVGAYGGDLLTWAEGVNWTKRRSGGSRIQALTYGEGRFVAVTGDGSFLVSSNGVTWRARVTEGAYSVQGLTWGDGVYAAVGDSGSVFVSPDGLTWTRQLSAPATALRGVAYGHGTYVAVGDGIVTSPDGKVWTQRTRRASGPLYATAHGAGRFVAVGQGIAGSRDGLLWSACDFPTTNALYGIAYGGARFVAVGEAGKIVGSADGTTWSVVATNPVTSVTVVTNGGVRVPVTNALPLYAVTYGQGRFVAVGERGAIVTSTDGLAWKPPTSQPLDVYSLHAITYAGGGFVAVGILGTILTSPDGENWSWVGPLEYNDAFYSVAYGDGIFVLSAGGTVVTWSETAGVLSRLSGNWDLFEPRPPWVTSNYGVTYVAGTFVLVNNSGYILTSTNGLDWAVDGATDGRLYGVTYGDGVWVAVGERGILESGKPRVILGIDGRADGAYAISVDGAAGLNGMIEVSADLVNWTVLRTFVGPNATFTFTDTPPATERARYYRAVVR